MANGIESPSDTFDNDFVSAETMHFQVCQVLESGVCRPKVKSENKGWLLICDLENRIVGLIDYFKEPSYFNGLELGYILYDEGSRNKGYVTEAVSLLIKFLFSTREINRIQILTLSANVASKKVAEKCGFKFEGVARGAFFHKGKNQDVEVYSILRDEATLL